MASNNCLIIDSKIKELAVRVGKELGKSITDYEMMIDIKLWQEQKRKKIKNFDRLPSQKEIVRYLKARDNRPGLPITISQFNKLKDALGEKICAAIGLDKLAVTDRSGNGTPKTQGWLRVANKDELRLYLASYIDCTSLRDTVGDTLSAIEWLSPAGRLEIYQSFLNRPTTATNQDDKLLASRALGAYNKRQLEELNSDNGNCLIIETKSHSLLTKARKTYTADEYNNRVNEVANLFSRCVDILIPIEKEKLEIEHNGKVHNHKDGLIKYDGKEWAKTENDIAILGDSSKRKVAISLLRSNDEKSHGPAAVLDFMHQRLRSAINATSDASMFSLVESMFGFEIKDKSNGIANTYREELKKLDDLLDYILQDASEEIELREGIRIMMTSDTTEIDPEDFDPEDSDQFKETWMYKYDTRSLLDSAFTPVKILLKSLPIKAANGENIKSLFGSDIYYPPRNIIETLHRKLVGVHDSNTMMEVIRDMGVGIRDASVVDFPWAKDIVEILEKDDNDTLRTQFFIDFRRAQKKFAGVKVDRHGNATVVNYSEVNRSKAITDRAKDNIAKGVTLEPRSVYTKKSSPQGDVVVLEKDNIAALSQQLAKVTEACGTIINEMPEIVAKNLKSRGGRVVIKTITEAIRALGIETSEEAVEEALGSEQSKSVNNLSRVLTMLNTAFKNLSGQKVTVNTLTNMTAVYNGIASIFIDESKDLDSTLPSIKDAKGDRRETFVQASLLDNIIEGLSGKRKRLDSSHRVSQISAQEFIEEKYGGYKFYKTVLPDGAPQWRLKWLEDISNGEFTDIEYKEILDYDGKDFAQWTEDERMLLAYTMFFDEKNGPMYMLPVTSDMQAARFVKAPRYNHDELVQAVSQIILQEIERAQDSTAIKQGSFANNKNKFCVFPELNKYYDFVVKQRKGTLYKLFGDVKVTPSKIGMDGFKEALAKLGKNDVAKRALIENAARYVLQMHTESFLRDYMGAPMAMIRAQISQLQEKGEDTSELEQQLVQMEADCQSFVENNTLAQAQMLELFGGDPAYYDNYEDLQKRFKSAIVPMKAIDIHNPNIRDDKSRPSGKRDYERCLYINDPHIASTVYDETMEFLKQLREEGRITPSQYDRMAAKAKDIKYTDGQAMRMLESYKDLKHMLGEYDQETDESIDRVVGNRATKKDLKTYVTAIKPLFYNLVGYHFNSSENQLVPVTHKCSEQILFPSTMNGAITKAPMLEALERIMKEYDADTIIFTSAVKTGNISSISIPTESNDYYSAIKQAIEDSPLNPFHDIPYEDGYGIVSEVPEHGIDHENAIGTQLQKIMPSDIPDDAIFTLPDGTVLNKAEMIKLYNSVWTEKIRRSYQNLTGEILDNAKLAAKLQRAAKTSKRNSTQLEHSFELDEWQNFIVPLADLANLDLTASFINAIVHKSVGKVKTNGGQFVQQTAFGVSENLSIKYETDAQGKKHLKHIECFMPAWSFDLVSQYMDYRDEEYAEEYTDEQGVTQQRIRHRRIYNNTLDVTKIPEDLLEAIGYRLPTASKSFMAPLKIVGFLPQISGNTIILPADIVYLTDSDYDVDKEFIILPSFNKDKKGNITRTKYNINDSVDGMEDGALNNMMLDLMRALLTSDETAGQVINAGGTDIITDVAQKMQELSSQDKILWGPTYVGRVLNQYAKNNDGKNMISVFAASLSSHATAQQTLKRDEEGKIVDGLRMREGVSLFGRKEPLSWLCLSRISDDRELISTYLGDSLNGAADNAKNPTLYWLNINSQTAGVATLLYRLGYTPYEVGLFLNIPSIREYAKSSFPAEFAKSINASANTKLIFPFTEEQTKDEIKRGFNLESDMQRDALSVFLALRDAANQLHQIDSLTRNDTGSGVPKGSLASNVARMIQYKHFLSISDDNRLIDGWEDMFKVANVEYENMYDDETLANLVEESNLPIAQSFTSYALIGEYRMMERHFPLIGNRAFLNAVYDLTKDICNADTVEPILKSALRFTQSTFPCFRYKGKSPEESYEHYIKEFPKEASEFIHNNPRLLSNIFIRDLVFGDDETGYPFIDLVAEGIYDEDKKNLYSNEWLKLHYDSDPEVRQLAQDLYVYSFHRNGLGPQAGSFAHLAPMEVKESLPMYKEYVGNIDAYDKIFNEFNRHMFETLYLRNNTQTIRFIPIDTPYPWSDKVESANNALPFFDASVIANLSYKKKKKYKFFFNSDGSLRKSFAARFKDGVVYYMRVDGTTYVRITPLGWERRAAEYAYTNNAVDKESSFKDYDIEKIEAVRKGITTNEEEQTNSTAAGNLSALIKIAMDGNATEEERQKAIALIEEYTGRKFYGNGAGSHIPSTPSTVENDEQSDEQSEFFNYKRYQVLTRKAQDATAIIDGNVVSVNTLYAFDKTPNRKWADKEWVFFDEDGNQIVDIQIGNETISDNDIINKYFAIPMKEDNSWLKSIIDEAFKPNDVPDATGQNMCPEIKG